jgi:hypothetical protein
VPEPPLFRRGVAQHALITNEGRAFFDDKLDNYYPQGSSQWDSLAHIAYGADQFYNGVTAEDITVRARNTIGHWATRGIAGRAVLIDIDAILGGAGVGFDPASPRAISAGELDTARVAAGVDWQPGDVLLLHTGFLGWHVRQEAAAREAMAERGALRNSSFSASSPWWRWPTSGGRCRRPRARRFSSYQSRACRGPARRWFRVLSCLARVLGCRWPP